MEYQHFPLPKDSLDYKTGLRYYIRNSKGGCFGLFFSEEYAEVACDAFNKHHQDIVLRRIVANETP